jgi:hypothetical protein
MESAPLLLGRRIARYLGENQVFADSQHKNIFDHVYFCIVGSAKSNVYHYPACESAKRIKLENLVGLSSGKDTLGVMGKT